MPPTQREIQVNKIMEKIEPGWRRYWCIDELCACMGCVNGSGHMATSYDEWVAWDKQHPRRKLDAFRRSDINVKYIWEEAEWSVDLTAAEIEQLAAGISPAFIRPDKLIRLIPHYPDSEGAQKDNSHD